MFLYKLAMEPYTCIFQTHHEEEHDKNRFVKVQLGATGRGARKLAPSRAKSFGLTSVASDGST